MWQVPLPWGRCARHPVVANLKLMAINGRPVILGGLLAGLVHWVGLAANGGVEALLFPVDFDLSLGDGQLQLLPVVALYGLSSAVTGLLMVWLYSLLAPRFGRGPRTAVVVGLSAWLLGLLPAVSAGLSDTSALSARLLVFSAVWQLLQLPIASTAGAWLYEKNRAATA